jgi:hypothetical protein
MAGNAARQEPPRTPRDGLAQSMFMPLTHSWRAGRLVQPVQGPGRGPASDDLARVRPGPERLDLPQRREQFAAGLAAPGQRW